MPPLAQIPTRLARPRLGFLLASWFLFHAALADWPMYRGNPSLSGFTTATVPAAPKLLWTFKTGADIASSPAIAGGRVYIGSGDSNLYCLNLADGRKIWSFRSGGPVESSPLILDGRVFFGDSNTNFHALDAKNGQRAWSGWGDGEFKGGANWLKAPDGRGAWIVAGNWDNRLYCWDAQTGKSNWVYETGNRINGSPAAGDGFTAFGGCDALVHVVSLVSGRKVREIDAGAYIAASAALVDGKAYVGQYEHEFLAVDLKEGRILWRYKDRSFPFMSSPAVAGDRIVVGSHDKRVHCIRRDTGEAVWTFATRGKVQGSPVVAADTVIVGSDDGRIYLLQLSDGRERWSYEIGKPVHGSAAVVQGRFVIGSDDGVVYCFGAQ